MFDLSQHVCHSQFEGSHIYTMDIYLGFPLQNFENMRYSLVIVYSMRNKIANQETVYARDYGN